MLNKKGFTIAEVIVSFSLIAIILTSIISATLFYRDKMKNEEIVTQLLDFKNNITKIVYDDIINKKIVRAENCLGTPNCVNLIDVNNNKYELKIRDFDTATLTNNEGAYLYYDDVQYMLPDSDLIANRYVYDNHEEIIRVCDFSGPIEISSYDDELYKIKIAFQHKYMDLDYDIIFIISS